MFVGSRIRHAVAAMLTLEHRGALSLVAAVTKKRRAFIASVELVCPQAVQARTVVAKHPTALGTRMSEVPTIKVIAPAAIDMHDITRLSTCLAARRFECTAFLVIQTSGANAMLFAIVTTHVITTSEANVLTARDTIVRTATPEMVWGIAVELLAHSAFVDFDSANIACDGVVCGRNSPRIAQRTPFGFEHTILTEIQLGA